jgi:hypothetical protein
MEKSKQQQFNTDAVSHYLETRKQGQTKCQCYYHASRTVIKYVQRLIRVRYVKTPWLPRHIVSAPSDNSMLCGKNDVWTIMFFGMWHRVDWRDVYRRFWESYQFYFYFRSCSQHANDICQTTRRYIIENIVPYSHTVEAFCCAGCCYSASAG